MRVFEILKNRHVPPSLPVYYIAQWTYLILIIFLYTCMYVYIYTYIHICTLHTHFFSTVKSHVLLPSVICRFFPPAATVDCSQKRPVDH